LEDEGLPEKPQPNQTPQNPIDGLLTVAVYGFKGSKKERELRKYYDPVAGVRVFEQRDEH